MKNNQAILKTNNKSINGIIEVNPDCIIFYPTNITNISNKNIKRKQKEIDCELDIHYRKYKNIIK